MNSSMDFVLQVVRHTPLWVWALLAALLWLGASQLRARVVSRARLLVLPGVLVALGLVSSATSFTPASAALTAWLLAFAVGLGLASRITPPQGARWDAAGSRLQLPGSALPLLLIVAVFLLRYVGGVSLALHPQWREALSVALPLAAVYGAIAGALAGRTLALLRAAPV